MITLRLGGGICWCDAVVWMEEGEGWVPTVGGLLCSLSRGPGAGASTQYSRDCRLGNSSPPAATPAHQPLYSIQ